MNMQRYPLFPLTAHLLPDGRMALRIFEPRYLRMVKEACATDSGFVVCMLNNKGDKEKNQHVHAIGTYAKVIDFDMLDDGLLGITVEGIYCVEISEIETESDELRTGMCLPLDNWSCEVHNQDIAPMVDKLRQVFEHYQDLAAIYETPKFDNPMWVLLRWLELLPVDAKQKQHFLEQKSCTKLLHYLSSLVL